jgi:hypothetical protein
MYRLFLVLVGPLFCLSVIAQNTKQVVTQELEKKSVDLKFKKVPNLKSSVSLPQEVFKTAESPRNNSIEKRDDFLLQELYRIQDERYRIESNSDLTPSQRDEQIKTNIDVYNKKKDEFMNYVSSKGVLTITSKEQGYYLSVLKYEDVDEYKRVLSLIKTSK